MDLLSCHPEGERANIYAVDVDAFTGFPGADDDALRPRLAAAQDAAHSCIVRAISRDRR
jgi:hypothetical protein